MFVHPNNYLTIPLLTPLFMARESCGKHVGSMWEACGNHVKLTAAVDRLAYLCKAALENHPLIVHRYGKDIRIVRYMMNVLYPSKPPPTFVRKGYEILPRPFSIFR